MKAAVYEKRGKSGGLVVREVEKPSPGPNEVLVKVHAASVNAGDYRSMRMGSIPKRKIFGSDVAGVVESVGPNVRSFRAGDEVAGDISGCGMGGFEEYAAAAESALAKKPVSLTFEQAAALPVAAVAALQALRKHGNVGPGHSVLIYGAGGGVGTFAVQLARFFCTEVTAVCSRRNAELVHSLGADRIVDYTCEDFVHSGKRYDRVIVINGRRTLSACKRALCPNGAAVIVGGPLSQVVKAMLLGPLLSLGGKKVGVLVAKPDAKDLEFILKLAVDGAIIPVIDRLYPLGETSEAVRYLGEGNARGKVVIHIAS
jgi:NADPH:quinone reductase-like Zn-dependent oxidoreductase